MFGAASFTQQDGTMVGGTQADMKKPKVEEKQQILPVTIRAIEQALEECKENGEELRFHGGEEPSSLLLVAVVESVIAQTASLELSLNDGTGRIKARYFVSESLPDVLDRVQPGRYINVVGSVRRTPEIHLGLLCLRLVESADEVSYHRIECGHAALRAQHKEKVPVAGAPLQESAVHMNATPPVVGLTPPTSTSEPIALATLRDTLSREAETRGEVGVSVTELLAALSSAGIKAAETELRKSLERMVTEGELFNTLDDDHFAPI